MKRQGGFTIVELLIVIVVIAILAAITITVYGNMQQRARNTQRIQAAKEWQKVITAYTSANSGYPVDVSTPSYHVCLGDQYPTDLDANPDVDCYASTNTKHPSAAFNAPLLSTLVSSLPRFPDDKMVTGTGLGTVMGLSFRSGDTLDPTPGANKTSYPMMHYWLYGTSQDCVLRPVAIAVSGGYVESSATFSSNDGQFTHCIILLPDRIAR